MSKSETTRQLLRELICSDHYRAWSYVVFNSHLSYGRQQVIGETLFLEALSAEAKQSLARMVLEAFYPGLKCWVKVNPAQALLIEEPYARLRKVKRDIRRTLVSIEEENDPNLADVEQQLEDYETIVGDTIRTLKRKMRLPSQVSETVVRRTLEERTGLRFKRYHARDLLGYTVLKSHLRYLESRLGRPLPFEKRMNRSLEEYFSLLLVNLPIAKKEELDNLKAISESGLTKSEVVRLKERERLLAGDIERLAHYRELVKDQLGLNFDPSDSSAQEIENRIHRISVIKKKRENMEKALARPDVLLYLLDTGWNKYAKEIAIILWLKELVEATESLKGHSWASPKLNNVLAILYEQSSSDLKNFVTRDLTK